MRWDRRPRQLAGLARQWRRSCCALRIPGNVKRRARLEGVREEWSAPAVLARRLDSQLPPPASGHLSYPPPADELSELQAKSVDLDITLLDKKIDQVGWVKDGVLRTGGGVGGGRLGGPAAAACVAGERLAPARAGAWRALGMGQGIRRWPGSRGPRGHGECCRRCHCTPSGPPRGPGSTLVCNLTAWHPRGSCPTWGTPRPIGLSPSVPCVFPSGADDAQPGLLPRGQRPPGGLLFGGLADAHVPGQDPAAGGSAGS